MLTKIVDGVEVVCSDDEEAAIKAEWETNEKRPQKKAASAEALLAALEKKGVLTKGDLEQGAAEIK